MKNLAKGLLFLALCIPHHLIAFEAIKSYDLLSKKLTDQTQQRSTAAKTIKINYTDEDLIDFINTIAGEKKLNVELPTGANAINAKLTLHIEPLLDIHEAWDILLSVLDLADYSVIYKDASIVIVKNSPAIGKEPMPLYIGTPPTQLPDNDERIRYLYYLSNLKVAEEDNSMLKVLLKDLLPATAIIKTDLKTNGLFISDKANNIKSAMTIIASLDQINFKETLEVIKLRHTSADIIAKLFMDTILNPEKDKSRYRVEAPKQTESSFFARNIKIIPERRTNTLLVLGREQAVNQIKDFIYKYVDVELESGKSILHVYQLQYLDAGALEPVLKNIVQAALPGGTGQSRAAGTQAGPERFFEEVRIKADTAREGSLSYGGNKLVIAAREEDWIVIRKLIEELDRPQRTVIIEILIADLTLADQKLLGMSLRNPAGLPFPNGVSFQTVHITPTFVKDFGTFPPVPASSSTLATDLMANTLAGGQSFASLAEPGSALVSFSDNNGKVWGIGQILKLLRNSKILSHPHVVATNNKPAKIKVGQYRLLPDQASAGTAATTITFTPQQANLEVNITPRISSSDVVNLNITVDVVDFVAGSSNARITRNINTSANVKSEDILALGGLIRTDSRNNLNETPLLAKIPIIGWLFKKRDANEIKTNLTVFISPTIIEPRLRGGASTYTKDYIKIAKRYSYEGQLFESLRDPITRWFFGTTDEAQEIVDEFLQKDELKRDILHIDEENIELAAGNPTELHQEHASRLQKMLASVENPLVRPGATN